MLSGVYRNRRDFLDSAHGGMAAGALFGVSCEEGWMWRDALTVWLRALFCLAAVDLLENWLAAVCRTALSLCTGVLLLIPRAHACPVAPCSAPQREGQGAAGSQHCAGLGAGCLHGDPHRLDAGEGEQLLGARSIQGTKAAPRRSVQPFNTPDIEYVPTAVSAD